MAKVVGSVDGRDRPVVRIPGRLDDLLVTVDTGFNGDVIVSPAGLTLLGLLPEGPIVDVELGNGSKASLQVIRAQIEWLDEIRNIQLLLAKDWQPSSDDPVGLIGVRLLTPHLLLIDFSGKSVEIEAID